MKHPDEIESVCIQDIALQALKENSIAWMTIAKMTKYQKRNKKNDRALSKCFNA
jgi:short subunit dehydrogenase-like uncharacterized protein